MFEWNLIKKNQRIILENLRHLSLSWAWALKSSFRKKISNGSLAFNFTSNHSWKDCRDLVEEVEVENV